MGDPPQSPVSENLSSSNAVTNAEKPFDKSAKADVILRSSDSIDFYVLKVILSLTSSIFDGMFSLDQGEGIGNEMKNGLAVVQLEEDGVTLYNLLQLIYPCCHCCAAEPHDFDVCVKVGRAAQKYAMDSVLQKLRRMVLASEDVVKRPLSVFAITAVFGWAEVTKEAALNTLSIPLRDLIVGQVEELHLLNAADYQALLQWRFACQDALDKLFTVWTRENRSSSWVAMAQWARSSLRETGCPLSAAVLVTPAKAFSTVQTPSKSNAPNAGNYYKTVLEECKAMAVKMDEVLREVPLKVNGIWVVPSKARSCTNSGIDERICDDISTLTDFL